MFLVCCVVERLIPSRGLLSIHYVDCRVAHGLTQSLLFQPGLVKWQIFFSFSQVQVKLTIIIDNNNSD